MVASVGVLVLLQFLVHRLAFAGKLERIKAGETPHPLMNAAGWTAQIANAEVSFDKRLDQERREGAR